MPGVWAVSQSHHAQCFLIRGTWDRGTASISSLLQVSVAFTEMPGERKGYEYFHGRQCIFLTHSASALWHDWQNGRGEERSASELGCKWGARQCELSHTHTASKNYLAHIRTQVELFINFLMRENNLWRIQCFTQVHFYFLNSTAKKFLNFKWGEEFELETLDEPYSNIRCIGEKGE